MATNPIQSLPEWDRLLAACQKNQPDAVRHLIKVEDVDPSHANRVGQSALHVAALWGHVECVKILLELGADPHATNQITGATPLHCAIQSSKAATIENRIEVVKLLLIQGKADPGFEDSYGRVPYDYLDPDEYGYLDPEDEKAEELCELLQPQMPLLFGAVLDTDVDKVIEILNESRKTDNSIEIEIFRQKYQSKTLFSVTTSKFLQQIEKGDLETSNRTFEILNLLVDNGCPIDELSTSKEEIHSTIEVEYDECPLHQICLALKSRYSQLSDDKDPFEGVLCEAAKLLHCHMKANSTEVLIPETEQLLHDSARRGNLKMSIFLIETLDINPSIQGRQGMTPLHFAARSGKTEIVKHLVTKYGVDVNLTDDRGKTALDAAMSNNREDIIAFLRERN